MAVVWSQTIGFSPNGIYQFPEEDGVYVIAEIINGTPKVRYVGQGNIYDRMELHKSSNEPNACLKKVMSDTSNVQVRSAIINNQTERDDAEYTYYKYYLDNEHNLCNEIIPSGKWLVGIPTPF